MRRASFGLAALAALASIGPAVEMRSIRREYPEREPSRREYEASRVMPHIGKKQIAKALKRAAKAGAK